MIAFVSCYILPSKYTKYLPKTAANVASIRNRNSTLYQTTYIAVMTLSFLMNITLSLTSCQLMLLHIRSGVYKSKNFNKGKVHTYIHIYLKSHLHKKVTSSRNICYYMPVDFATRVWPNRSQLKLANVLLPSLVVVNQVSFKCKSKYIFLQVTSSYFSRDSGSNH